jgi:hypothetical protein
VLRRSYWPKRKEVSGECRKLHNEELHNLFSSENTLRRSNEVELYRWDMCRRGGKDRQVLGLVGNTEENSHLNDKT